MKLKLKNNVEMEVNGSEREIGDGNIAGDGNGNGR